MISKLTNCNSLNVRYESSKKILYTFYSYFTRFLQITRVYTFIAFIDFQGPQCAHVFTKKINTPTLAGKSPPLYFHLGFILALQSM